MFKFLSEEITKVIARSNFIDQLNSCTAIPIDEGNKWLSGILLNAGNRVFTLFQKQDKPLHYSSTSPCPSLDEYFLNLPQNQDLLLHHMAHYVGRGPKEIPFGIPHTHKIMKDMKPFEQGDLDCVARELEQNNYLSSPDAEKVRGMLTCQADVNKLIEAETDQLNKLMPVLASLASSVAIASFLTHFIKNPISTFLNNKFAKPLASVITSALCLGIHLALSDGNWMYSLVAMGVQKLMEQPTIKQHTLLEHFTQAALFTTAICLSGTASLSLTALVSTALTGYVIGTASADSAEKNPKPALAMMSLGVAAVAHNYATAEATL